MTTYYLYENGKQKGPYSFEDLKKRSITTDTAIWKEGMTEWAEAGKVEELVSILVKTPPAYHNKVDVRQTPGYLSAISEASEKDRRFEKYFSWIGIIVAAIFVVAYFTIDNEAGNEGLENKTKSGFSFSQRQSPAPLRSGLLQKEKQSPESYISNSNTWRKNIVGETVLEGTLSNASKMADFENIVLEVQWLSKTNTVMETKRLTVNEFIGAGKSVKYKLKSSGPSKFGNVRVSVVSATTTD